MPPLKPRAPAPLESEVTAAVRAASRLYGIELKRRNVGVGLNPNGRTVRFGAPGDSDWYAVVGAGPNRGRLLCVEVKRGDFDPRRLRGARWDHFARQLAGLTAVNAAGGLGVWVRDAIDAADFFRKAATVAGLVVTIDDDGFCFTEAP